MPAWGAYHTPRHARYPHNGGIDTSAQRLRIMRIPPGVLEFAYLRAKLWSKIPRGPKIPQCPSQIVLALTKGCTRGFRKWRHGWLQFFAHKIALKAAQSVT